MRVPVKCRYCSGRPQQVLGPGVRIVVMAGAVAGSTAALPMKSCDSMSFATASSTMLIFHNGSAAGLYRKLSIWQRLADRARRVYPVHTYVITLGILGKLSLENFEQPRRVPRDEMA